MSVKEDPNKKGNIRKNVRIFDHDYKVIDKFVILNNAAYKY